MATRAVFDLDSGPQKSIPIDSQGHEGIGSGHNIPCGEWFDTFIR
jgi:hypothetical protein